MRLIGGELSMRVPRSRTKFVTLRFIGTRCKASVQSTMQFPGRVGRVLKVMTSRLKVRVSRNSLRCREFLARIGFLLREVCHGRLLRRRRGRVARVVREGCPGRCSYDEGITSCVRRATSYGLSKRRILCLALRVHHITVTSSRSRWNYFRQWRG